MNRIHVDCLSRALAWPVIWMLAGCGASPVQAAAPPAALAGTWEVAHVAVDQRDQPHWLYFPDDPRLLGRDVSIDGSKITIDNDSRDCVKPSVAALPRISLQTLVGRSFSRPPQEDTPVHPTLSDFGLPLADSAVVPLKISCDPETSQWNDTWLVPVAADRLLTNYDNSGFILVLERRGATSPIRPSFSCTNAQGATERAICASATLAGYDRSVAAAYRRALTLAGDGLSDLRREQKQWLAQRNACGGDTECLTGSMRRRVDQLMQQ